MGLDMLVEIVGVKRAEQAAGGPGLYSQYLPVIGIAHGPCPAHLHQRIAVFKQCQFAGLGPAAFLPHDPHVHFVGVKIQRQGCARRACSPEVPGGQTAQ